MNGKAVAAVLAACVFGAAGCDAGATATAGPAASQGQSGATNATTEARLVKVKVINKSGQLVGPVESARVVKTDTEWQKLLTPEQYEVARAKGTERAFCGNLLDNHMSGVYACVCCGLPLFSSDTKFNSGTGWPSFFQPVAKENVVEHTDRSYGMTRTEVLCARCDGHLGHVFHDGPRPTGLRFCVNSESLKFVPKEKLATLADPAAEPTAASTSPAPAEAPDAPANAR